jgi:uncharacterized glyoxalase superfamily protein PhnB
MLECTPFLLFDGNCAEAMTFYHQCLGGELTLTKAPASRKLSHRSSEHDGDESS